MSGVLVRSFQAQTGGIGNLFNFYSTNFPSINTISRDFASLGSTSQLIVVGANRVTVGPGTGGGPVQMFIPLRCPGARDRNQFAQITYAQDNSGGGVLLTPTLAVFCSGIATIANNQLTMFAVRISKNSNVATLVRMSNWISGTTVINETLDTMAYPALGTVIRLEGRQLAINQIQLKVFYDGVLQSTQVSAANIGGSPAWGTSANASPGVTFGFENFSCGIL